jgi:hypothetical protein
MIVAVSEHMLVDSKDGTYAMSPKLVQGIVGIRGEL